MDLNEIPKSASEITAGWMTAALNLENNDYVSEIRVEERWQKVLVSWEQWHVCI